MLKQQRLQVQRTTIWSFSCNNPGEVNPVLGAMERTFKLLVKPQKQKVPLDLDTCMGCSLSPVPHCLGTLDWFFTNTNKALMMHFMMEDHSEVEIHPKNSMFVQDGNTLFHTMTNLAPTFRGIILQLLDLMQCKRDFVFSMDCYHLGSIKTWKRSRQGCKE